MQHPLVTSWDDLLDGIHTPEQWSEKRAQVQQRFLALLRDDAAPDPPQDVQLQIEREWHPEGYRVQYVSYNVEPDERAYAYLAIPDESAPDNGYPSVVCLQGTTDWGAMRTLGILPAPDAPQSQKSVNGLTDARNLVRRGYVTLSPEHFCQASRCPPEGSADTAAFYRRHPDWSAVGKATYENSIAVSVLASMPEVNAERIGATGHSLGGQGTIWLAAYDERVKCAVPSCPAGAFRENPNPLVWSRDHWYIYFPQLREQMLAGETIQCDFHEMMALIAPRPCLELFALNDGDLLMNQHRAAMHLKLGELYHLLGCDSAHAFAVFGDGHSMPDLSRAITANWMDRWLRYDGDPLGAWDSRPTLVHPG
jgi:dienelactone hydrolase